MVSAFVVIKNPFVIAIHAIPFIFIHLANFGHLWVHFLFQLFQNLVLLFWCFKYVCSWIFKMLQLDVLLFICSWLVQAPPLVSNWGFVVMKDLRHFLSLTFPFPFALSGEFFATSTTSICNCFYANAYAYVLLATLSDAFAFVFLGCYMMLLLLRF